MQYTKLSLLIASLSMASGCSLFSDDNNNTNNNSTTPPNNDDSEVIVVKPETPNYPTSTQLKLNITDEQNNLISDASISLLSDPSELIKSINGSTINIDQSKLTDSNLDGQLDVPLSMTFKLSADGYLEQRSVVLIKDFGENEQNFVLTQADEQTLEAQGIFKQTSMVDLTNVSTNADGYLEIPAKVNSPLATQIQISPETVFLDNEGVQVLASEIEVEAVSYSSDSPKLPILSAEKATNLNTYNEQVSDNQQIEAGSDIQFKSLGVLDIKVTAGDTNISNLMAEKPFKVTINIPNNSENPHTGELISAGDSIPVWSLSEADSNWVFEGLVEVTESQLGTLIASFTTHHLTQFNLAYVQPSQTCSGVIYVKDVNGQAFSERGSFSFSNTRFYNTDNYLGSRDGRISYYKVPDEATDISFKNTDNSVSILLDQTTVNYDNSVTQITNTLPGVDLCKASGSTLTLVSDSPTPEVTIVSPRRSFTYVNEGNNVQQQNIEVQITNPGEQSVEVSYSVSSHYGATDGEDFTAKTSSVILNASNPTDTLTFDIIGDEAPEALYESIKVAISLPEGITFSTGGNHINRYYSVRDDDLFIVNSFTTVSASEADGQAKLRVTLDKQTPDEGFIYLQYRVFSAETDTAIAQADYQQYQYESYQAGGQYKWTRVPNGVTSFDIDIPINNDIDVEGDETFSVEILKDQYISAESERVLTKVTIEDDDTVSAAPTEFTLDVNNVSELTEGQFTYATVTLDQATDSLVNMTLETSDSSRLYFAGETPSKLSLSFAPGEATKVVPMIARDNNIVESHVDVTITAIADDSLGTKSAQIKVLDNDYHYVWMTIEQTPHQVFEDMDENVIWRFNYFTNATDGNDGFNLTPVISPSSTATEGNDYSMDLPSSLNFSQSSSLPQITFNPTADTEVESSEWVMVNFSGNLPDTASYRYYLFGSRWYPGSQVNFTQSLVIGNDDIFTLSVPKTREFRIESASDEATFEASSINDALTINSNANLDFDLTFKLSLLQTDQTNMSLLTLADEQITLAEGANEAPINLNLLAANAQTLGVSEDKVGRYKALLKIELTEESLQQLKDNGVEFVMTNSEIELNFIYFVKGSTPNTGATGTNN